MLLNDPYRAAPARRSPPGRACSSRFFEIVLAYLGQGSGQGTAAPAVIAMTSQGTASGRFTRAIQRSHLLAAEMAGREIGHMSLSNALSPCVLYRREHDQKFDRAAVRWV